MFNLDDYEDVASLNIWLNENYPMNRVEVEVIKHDPEKGFILCKASIWRDSSDPFPAASNIAFGSRDQYNRNMARFYCEDVATSAIGRAIIILKGSQKTATKESMARVSETQDEVAKVKAKMAQTSTEYIPVAKADDPWTVTSAAPVTTMEQAVEMVKDVLGGTAPNESCIHGARIWKTGTSRNGNKPWGHWKCIAHITGEAERCEPVWYEISADGSWKPQVKR
jgi:hypothetical protein